MSLPSFEDFYQAVHDHLPFPWQCRAAKRLALRTTFAVTVPSGLGKSSLVDAAVWAAARGAWRRIIFVIDRRLVVDEVYKNAQLIKKKLLLSQASHLLALQKRLGEIQVVRLRGGVFGDDDWVLYPERLSIVLTTVDQLGSRLLFRGYGVSPKRWPMHAGFFSDDTLIVVDEAHLSMPFLQTLNSLKEAGANLALIPMSATLKSDWSEETLGLREEDRALDIVRQRLSASKKIHLREVGISDKEFAKEALAALHTLCEKRQSRKVAMVVNRVSTARTLFELLRKKKIDCTLMTGRIRPIERDWLVDKVLPQIKAGRTRSAEDELFVVVATQTIEVGADFDFDALISECAPLSALRQRFGRLDRRGLLGETHGWILRRNCHKDDPNGQKADPVYREASAQAWEWLKARAADAEDVVDFGLNTFDKLLAEAPAPTEDCPLAATLLPSHIHALSQTGPYAPKVDLTGWLHGPTNQIPDVVLVWRDDLNTLQKADWKRAVSLLPPLLREGLSLPLDEARAFLMGMKSAGTLSDLNGSDAKEKNTAKETKQVLRWCGPKDREVIPPNLIQPGDTLVLPSNYGGCDQWGWAPKNSSEVPDLADDCQLEKLQAREPLRFTLRLVDGHRLELGAEEAAIWAQASILRTLLGHSNEESAVQEDMAGALSKASHLLLKLLKKLPSELKNALQHAQVESHPAGLVVRGRGIEDFEDHIETGRPVSLEQHHHDVALWAKKLNRNHPQRAALVEAAAIHDAGKAEARMQNLLYGHPLYAALGPVLAKSALRSREQQHLAYRHSGLPEGFRHEFASLDFVQIEDPLIRHLVATHHGHGRPWLKNCSDPTAPGAHFAVLDNHWPQHFSEALSRHGAWRLAQLEWRLRAADARASMEESLQQEGDLQ